VVATHWLNDRALLVAEQPALSVTVTVTVRQLPSSCGWRVTVRVLPLPLSVPADATKVYVPVPPLAVTVMVTTPLQPADGTLSEAVTGWLTVKLILFCAVHVPPALLAVTVTVCEPGAKVLVDEQPLDGSVVVPSLNV
jgi:hypothetical protein